MRLKAATSVLLGGLVSTAVIATVLAAGLGTIDLSQALAAGAKKEDAHKKDDGHGKPAKPEPVKERIEPLPLSEPAKLPSGRNAYDMMRELRQMQDRVANGDADSMLTQRPLIEKMAEEFEKAEDAVWDDPRNARAVIAFVLSGGDVKVLRGLLLRGQPKSIDPNLGRAVHAFASNRRSDALEYFGKLDPLALDPTIAGPMALAQAEFMARTNLDAALEKLDIARLLGPGTLLEEAALRRKVAILSGQKKFAEADRMLEIYFRRFTKSGYAGGLKRQFVRFVGDRPPLEAGGEAKSIVVALDRLPARDKLEIYVEMAKEAAMRSRRDFVMFATEKAFPLADEGSTSKLRSKIYLAAMQVASLDSEKVKASLEELKPSVQNKEDLELISAVQSIADEIGRVGTVTPTDQPDPTWRNELGQTFHNVGRAQSLLAEADRLIVEASK